jgi:hypothetical protein
MQRDRGAAAHHSRLARSQRGEATTVGCKEVNCGTALRPDTCTVHGRSVHGIRGV